MAIVILIGRILFGLIFVGAGIGHLAQPDDTAGYAESRGIGNGKLMAQVSGVLILLGGLGVILGIYPDLAALGLVAYVLIAAFLVHHFWTDDDPQTQTVEMSMFMKNLSIAGGGLLLFALMGLLGEQAGLTITGPLFDLSL